MSKDDEDSKTDENESEEGYATIEHEHTIDGFSDGSLAIQILYTVGISAGSLLLAFVIPIVFLNERKYYNLKNIENHIEDRLIEATEKTAANK